MNIDRISLKVILDLLKIKDEEVEDELSIISDTGSTKKDVEDAKNEIIDLIISTIEENEAFDSEAIDQIKSEISEDFNDFLYQTSEIVYDTIIGAVLYEVHDKLEETVNGVKGYTTIDIYNSAYQDLEDLNFEDAIDKMIHVLNNITTDINKRIYKKKTSKKISKNIDKLQEKKEECRDEFINVRDLNNEEAIEEFQPRVLDDLIKNIDEFTKLVAKIKKDLKKKPNIGKKIVAGILAASVGITGFSILKHLNKDKNKDEDLEVSVENPQIETPKESEIEKPNVETETVKSEVVEAYTEPEIKQEPTETTNTITESKPEPVVVTPEPTPVQEEVVEQPKKEDENEQFRSLAEQIHNNWANLGANYSIDDIIEVIKVLNGYDSAITLNQADDIILDVIDKAINPAMNNILSGSSIQTYTVDVASLLIKNQSGIEAVRRMQNNLNSLIQNNNMDSVAISTLTTEGVLLEENQVEDLNLNQSSKEAIILWSRLAIGANGIIGLGDHVAYVNDEVYTVDNSYVFENIISNAINQGKSY